MSAAATLATPATNAPTATATEKTESRPSAACSVRLKTGISNAINTPPPDKPTARFRIHLEKSLELSRNAILRDKSTKAKSMPCVASQASGKSALAFANTAKRLIALRSKSSLSPLATNTSAELRTAADGNQFDSITHDLTGKYPQCRCLPQTPLVSRSRGILRTPSRRRTMLGGRVEQRRSLRSTESKRALAGQPHKGGLVGAASRFMSGRPLPPNEQRIRLHLPTPADLATLAPDLPHSDPPAIISAEGKEKSSKAALADRKSVV